MLGNLTGWHMLIILAVVILLFGAAKLPALAKAVGQSTKIFKAEMKTDAAAPATAAEPAVLSEAAPVPVVAPAASTMPAAAPIAPAAAAMPSAHIAVHSEGSTL